MRTLEEILFFTNCQKILSFLIQSPDKEFYDREISRLTGASRAGTNFALRELAQAGLISCRKQGRMNFYQAHLENAYIKYLKILQNLAGLFPLVKKLESLALKVVLYGSAARGENTAESDIDIFIISRTPHEVEKVIFNDDLREKLQYVSTTPNELVKLRKNNPAFLKEVEKGIVLWAER